MFKNIKLAVQLGALAALLLVLMVGVAGFGLSMLLTLSGLTAHAKPSKDAIKPGMSMPQIRLLAPASNGLKEYLGLGDVKTFSTSDVSAKLLIVEVLSST